MDEHSSGTPEGAVAEFKLLDQSIRQINPIDHCELVGAAVDAQIEMMIIARQRNVGGRYADAEPDSIRVETAS